jgi:hypothetical protein
MGWPCRQPQLNSLGVAEASHLDNGATVELEGGTDMGRVDGSTSPRRREPIGARAARRVPGTGGRHRCQLGRPFTSHGVVMSRTARAPGPTVAYSPDVPYLGRLSPTAREAVVVLSVVTAAAVAAFAFVLWFHEYVASISRIRGFLNVNGEANFPAWWNATLLLLVAFCALVARVQESDRARRRAWLLVAVAGLLMSMDEVTSLHERLGRPVRSAGIDPPTFAWLIPGVVIAATGFFLLVRVGRALPPPARGVLLIALSGYAAGAIGVETINGFLLEGRWLYYAMGTTVEETLEMAACIVAIGAIINQITTRPDATPLSALSVRLEPPESQKSPQARRGFRPRRPAPGDRQGPRHTKVPTL